MCIIIAKPAGAKKLDEKILEKAWTSNPDGGGVVWKKPNEDVYFQKGFMKKEEFLEKLKEINEDDTAFIAHFRIRSVGAVNAQNTHPFVMDYVTFAHNGTLSLTPFEGKTDSETFGLKFLKDKSMDWIKENHELLEMALGTSKFAIMDNESGEIFILNKDRGEERDGAWFSNQSAFPVVQTRLPYKYYDSTTETTQAYAKSDKSWGTKNFKYEWGTFSKDKGCWIYSYSHARVRVPWYQDIIVLSKRGFYMIDGSLQPDETLPTKKYTTKSKEVRLVEALTRLLFQKLKVYHNTSFLSEELKKGNEQELSGMYTVINCMRRLIKAQKEISFESLVSFCIDNIKPVAGAVNSAAYDDTYLSSAEDMVDVVLDVLENRKEQSNLLVA